jgi:GMP synthase (glutamine-hydrolysing)
VREARVYSEIVPFDAPVSELLERRPKGIILSGGPESVYAQWAPTLDPGIYEAGVPILGICYGAQLLTRQLGGMVERTGRPEYGRTPLTRIGSSPLFCDWPAQQSVDVWMSHADSITEVPPGFVATATTAESPVAALDDTERHIHGVQFHPEVLHTARGQELLERFLFDVCGARPSWTHTNIIESSVEALRAQVGGARVLCALSGGVDSAVAAALVHRAVGAQLTCVFVDTGLMRAGEGEQVEETFRSQFHVDLVHVKATDRFFGILTGLTDPEEKRKAIGETFIRVFEEVARDAEDARFLVQGTLYPDIIESGTGDAATIK